VNGKTPKNLPASIRQPQGDSVSVSPDGDLHFTAMLGPPRRNGTEPFFEEVPDVILDLIRQTCVC